MLQEEYRKRYKEINRDWTDSISVYRSLVRKNIQKDSIVLEAGCGFSSMFEKEYNKARKVIGVDINADFLNMNVVIDEKIVSDLSNLSKIGDSSIDIIISSWVLEHLKEPMLVFKEFERVLKRGGKIIFITPNSLNYVVFLNRLIPKFLRKVIVGKMSEDLVTDPMPAYYKSNSIKKIKSLANQSNLIIGEMILNGDPTYIAVNKFLFYIGVIIEKILDISFFKKFKVHIIGVLEK